MALRDDEVVDYDVVGHEIVRLRTSKTPRARAVSEPKDGGKKPREFSAAAAALRTSERENRVIPAADDRGEGGSRVDAFNLAILRATVNCIQTLGPETEEREKLILTAITALYAFKPQDEIEGMMAAQAVALHFGSMEALRRSMLPGQPADIAARLRKDGANLARAMADMVDALDRKRGKAQQVVRVERVVVKDGGQAIVGNVNAPTPEGTGGRP
jgi:hypothetical protein